MSGQHLPYPYGNSTPQRGENPELKKKKRFCGDAILVADRSGASESLELRNGTGHSIFVLGIFSVESYPAPGITETTFVGQWLCLSFDRCTFNPTRWLVTCLSETQKAPFFIPNLSIPPLTGLTMSHRPPSPTRFILPSPGYPIAVVSHWRARELRRW